MSGPCQEHLTMDTGSFSAHIQELAESIKDRIAKLAADTVHEEAHHVQTSVKNAIDDENRRRHQEAMDTGAPSYTPLEMPADKGYSLLSEPWREVVDDYRDNYDIDLLTFTSYDAAEAESALKNEHLTWIPELFSRGGNLPKPQQSEPQVTALEDLAGSGQILSIEDPDDIPSWADGTFGTVLEADITTIKAAVKDGWESSAASTFRNVFLKQVPNAATNQIDVIRVMRNLLAAHQGLLVLARGSVDAIAHHSIEALDGFEKCCKGGVSVQTILGVAAGLAAIAGGIAGLAAGGTGAALIGAGISIVSGTINTAKTLDGAINGDGTMAVGATHELGGDRVDDLVENMREALETTYGDLDEAYGKLSEHMSNLQNLMTQNESKVRAPRPGGTDGPGLLDTDEDTVVDATMG